MLGAHCLTPLIVGSKLLELVDECIVGGFAVVAAAVFVSL